MKKTFKILGILFGLVFIAGISAVVYAKFIVSDLPNPPADDDLLPRVNQVEHDKNAYYMFEQAMDRYEIVKEIDGHQLYKVIETKVSDVELLGKFLDQNREFIDFLDNIPNLAYQMPTLADPFQTDIFQSINQALPDQVDAARVILIRVRYDFLTGKEKKALDDILSWLSFFENQHRSNQNLIDFLVVSTKEKLFLEELGNIIHDSSTLNTEDYYRISTILENLSEDLYERFKYSLKIEYVIQKQVVKNLENETKSFFANYVFQANRTMHLLAQIYRQLQSDLPRKCVLQNENYYFVNVEKFVQINLYDKEGIDRITELAKKNSIGKLALVGLVPRVNGGWVNSLCVKQVQIAGIITMAAIKGYFVEHKTLPENLEELEPHYVKSIPKDPLADELFQYSKTQKKLTSKLVEELKKVINYKYSEKDGIFDLDFSQLQSNNSQKKIKRGN